jgi:hypothetical protein
LRRIMSVRGQGSTSGGGACEPTPPAATVSLFRAHTRLDVHLVLLSDGPDEPSAAALTGDAELAVIERWAAPELRGMAAEAPTVGAKAEVFRWTVRSPGKRDPFSPSPLPVTRGAECGGPSGWCVNSLGRASPSRYQIVAAHEDVEAAAIPIHWFHGDWRGR